MGTKRERLLEVLELMDTEELVDVHNKYCEECNYPDDHIYQMTEIEDVGDIAPLTLLNMVFYGSFNPNQKYFWYDGYGNLASSDYPEYGDNQQIFTADIASAMERCDDSFGSDECREILDESDEEDEEE